MNYIYEVILKPILTNQIIVDWIAPILTGLIVLLIPSIVTRTLKNRNLLKNIKEVNNKIINTIRPFIIERININSHFISDIRKGVIKESGIKEKYIFNEIEIRNKILLDISETMFLKENEKQSLINFTYEIFKDFDEKQIANNIHYEDIEEQKNKKIAIVSSSVIFISSLVIMLIAYIIKPVDTNLEDNIIILITMISIILSLFSLIMENMGMKTLYGNIAEIIHSSLYVQIKNISKKIKKDN